MLFAAAKDAGVGKIVHISITNPSLDSPLPYFRGKAEVESALQKSGLRYAILRPTVIFGTEGILINNIAWIARHLPSLRGAGQRKVSFAAGIRGRLGSTCRSCSIGSAR